MTDCEKASELLRRAINLLQHSNDLKHNDVTIITQHGYDRAHHFQEMLTQFQAKQKVNLSDDALMQIWLLLQEHYGVTKKVDVELFMIRPVIKELDLRKRASPLSIRGTNPRKLYEHYMLIYVRLSGKQAPQLT